MARSRHVIFIEEPILDTTHQAYLELTYIDEHLLVVRPHSPIDSLGFSGEQMPILKKLLCEFFAEQGMSKCVAWFYTPLALPLLSELPYDLVVYDCMHTLNAFLNAPPLLKQREQELLDKANLVFTGGPSLFRRLEGRHPRVHHFCSCVDDEPARFAALCQKEILESATHRAQQLLKINEELASTTWDTTTNAMLSLIDGAITGQWNDNAAAKSWSMSWKLQKNILV